VAFDQADVLPVPSMSFVLDTKGRHRLLKACRDRIPTERTEYPEVESKVAW